MSSFYRITAPARKDLDTINDYIAADDLDAADRLLETVYEQCRLLANFPNMGRRRDNFSPGLRSFPVSSYLILYRSIEGGIEIVRVLSGYRDLEALFSTENED